MPNAVFFSNKVSNQFHERFEFIQKICMYHVITVVYIFSLYSRVHYSSSISCNILFLKTIILFEIEQAFDGLHQATSFYVLLFLILGETTFFLFSKSYIVQR